MTMAEFDSDLRLQKTFGTIAKASYRARLGREKRRRYRSVAWPCDRDVVERVYGVLNVAGRSIFLLGKRHEREEQQSAKYC